MKTATIHRLGERLGWAGLVVLLLAACDNGVVTAPGGQDGSPLATREADAARVDTSTANVSATLMGAAAASSADFRQIVFIDEPDGVSGATSTSVLVDRFGGYFTTVYNTSGESVGGAITFGRLDDGRVRGAYDITTEDIEFTEAQVREVGRDEHLFVTGSARTDAGLDLASPAVFLTSDLRRSTRVFDLPSYNATSFDFLDDRRVAVATGYEGSIVRLDPFQDDSEDVLVEGLPSLQGLDVEESSIHVTDVDGRVRSFDGSGTETGSIDLPGALNPEERAEVSVCGSHTLVGAHTSGVLLFGDSGTQTVDDEFGIGASMVEDCSAFAATTEGAVVVGVADGSGGFDVFRLDTVRNQPLPYASSVEIIPLDEEAEDLVDWRSDDDYLLVVSSSEGTHFITVELP